MTEIAYKGTVFAYFDDIRVRDTSVDVEHLINRIRTKFPALGRSEVVDLLEEYTSE